MIQMAVKKDPIHAHVIGSNTKENPCMREIKNHQRTEIRLIAGCISNQRLINRGGRKLQSEEEELLIDIPDQIPVDAVNQAAKDSTEVMEARIKTLQQTVQKDHLPIVGCIEVQKLSRQRDKLLWKRENLQKGTDRISEKNRQVVGIIRERGEIPRIGIGRIIEIVLTIAEGKVVQITAEEKEVTDIKRNPLTLELITILMIKTKNKNKKVQKRTLALKGKNIRNQENQMKEKISPRRKNPSLKFNQM